MIGIAAIFSLDGYIPSGENLILWRNFILTKLRGIVAQNLETDHKKYIDKWSIFQRHARTYIGLILADIGKNELHESHENKQELFQAAWEAFGEAQKFSTSKNLILFKLYLTVLKGFVPEEFDENSIKAENEDLWSQYTAVKSAEALPQFLRKKTRSSSEGDLKVVRELGPSRKGSRSSKGASIQTRIEEALLSLRVNNFRDPEDTAAASVAQSREDGERGASDRESDDEDDRGHDQHMQPKFPKHL